MEQAAYEKGRRGRGKGSKSKAREVKPSPLEELEQEARLQHSAARWIEENHGLAIVGGFVLGVLIGASLRS